MPGLSVGIFQISYLFISPYLTTLVFRRVYMSIQFSEFSLVLWVIAAGKIHSAVLKSVTCLSAKQRKYLRILGVVLDDGSF